VQLADLIEALSDPEVYPHPVATVEVRQTHISVVFLAGPFVYKIKKPVNLGFLDFSSLENRHHFCDEEMRLNARLAPGVYRGVVPVSRCGSGVAVEGSDEAVEWAVKMERLADEATLEHRLRHGAVDDETISKLARTIAAFHRHAERGKRIAACGRFDVVAANARQNFAQSAPQRGVALSQTVWDNLQRLTEEVLGQQCALIEARAQRGVSCDTHGDLRLEHVYLFPEREPPADLLIIDCIEFNEQLRFADPVADIAFLVMDLKFHGRHDLARTLIDAYFLASDDQEGRALLPLYCSYRAAVRGKVEGLKMSEPEVPESERLESLVRARQYWLLALQELEPPGRRPGLVLIGGLPGTGKSTLAAELAAQAGLSVIRTDVVRKELAGVLDAPSSGQAFERGIYSPEWTERTYQECLRRVEQMLFEGQRVVIDASFREEVWRRTFLDVAKRWGVGAVLLLCHAEADTVRQRLDARRGDASDADWKIYLQAAQAWQEPEPATSAAMRTIDTQCASPRPLDEALSALREVQLFA
jgi:hypothetical protein